MSQGSHGLHGGTISGNPMVEERPYKQVFFTSRFELGHASVYDKLGMVNNILNASN